MKEDTVLTKETLPTLHFSRTLEFNPVPPEDRDLAINARFGQHRNYEMSRVGLKSDAI